MMFFKVILPLEFAKFVGIAGNATVALNFLPSFVQLLMSEFAQPN